jgi:tetratricopeptide (TPR) repeat protein
MQKDTIHTTELDTVYMAGVASLKNLDYKTAVEKLRPYGDYNSALAFLSADYNHSALMILERLADDDARICYVKALVYARLQRWDDALEAYERSVCLDPYMIYRANLDPEMSLLLKNRQINH